MPTTDAADPKTAITLQLELLFHDMQFSHAQSLIAFVGVVSRFVNSTMCTILAGVD
jgi:hypothetical protein